MRMKDRLRRSIAEKRNALSPSEVFEKSSRIKKEFLKWISSEMHRLFFSMYLMITKYSLMI